MGVIYWCESCQIDWWVEDFVAEETGGKCLKCLQPWAPYEEAMSIQKLAGDHAALDLADARRGGQPATQDPHKGHVSISVGRTVQAKVRAQEITGLHTLIFDNPHFKK